MTQSQLEALLGRPLTSVEVTNRELYLKLAKSSIEDLLCIDLDVSTEEREFDIRENYRTVFTDIFTDVEEVKINDEVITDFSKRQWDKRKADWYNSIVLNYPTCDSDDVLTVTADWGFDYCSQPDFQLLLARAFALIGTQQSGNSSVQSKQVEDFRITFKENGTDTQQFIADNQATINKYSMCGIGEVRHGRINRKNYGASAHWWIKI